MKTHAELVIAIASGLCGLLSAILVVIGYQKPAAVIAGFGLFLCNVVWVMRLT